MDGRGRAGALPEFDKLLRDVNRAERQREVAWCVRESVACMARLVVLGDSWVCSDTWPEIVARRWKWESINLAKPHSGSSMLSHQLHLLNSMVANARDDNMQLLDEDVVAIIHTGGNDLYFAPPAEVAALAGAAVSGCHHCKHPLIVSRLTTNVQRAVIQLMELGCRRIALVGVPLCARMPFIAQPVANIPFGSCVARVVMQACNSLLISGLRRSLDEAQGSTDTTLQLAMCLDEAAALDTVLSRANSPEDMWEDISHPTYALHAALGALRALNASCSLTVRPVNSA